MAQRLEWPREWARDRSGEPLWFQPDSNICLDFHGDPLAASLVVFSDGNHHMALAETLACFRDRHPAVGDVFYATTPPGVLVSALEAGGVSVGNLFLSARPHVFISPPAVLDMLAARGLLAGTEPFMRSRGNVLLVRAANPREIRSARDLARADVRVFLSNPVAESASYQVYAETLMRHGARLGVAFDFLLSAGGTPAHARVEYGQRVHHREAPQAVHDGRADVAVLYYHLALRYTRVFPGCFEIVALDGGHGPEPLPSEQNVITDYHAGMIGDGGEWGRALLAFLASAEVTEIYRYHGLSRPSP